MSKKKKREHDYSSGYFLGPLLIGTGIGLFTGHTAVGAVIGLGVGFILQAIIKSPSRK